MHTRTIEPWTHDHTFGQDARRRGERPTLVVAILTIVTMVAEIVAGWAFGSMALLADGMHMGSHAMALGLSVFTYAYARRHAGNPRFTFGTGKVNALGAYTSAVVLVGFALVMAWESGLRFFNPVPIVFDWALAVAVVGLVINGVSALLLTGREAAREPYDRGHAGEHSTAETHGDHHRHDHHHHHQHDHNLRSAYLHVLADALTSVFAIVALLAGKYLGAVWLDPLMGIVGAVLVARWAWHLLRDTSGILLDQRADEHVRQHVRRAIEGEADNRLADLHVWSVGPGIYAAALSVVTHDPREPEHYRALLPTRLGIVHSTIEVHQCREATA